MPSWPQVGFSSQRIRYKWLERTAQMCLAGMSPPEIIDALHALLATTLASSGSSGRGSRERATTILKRIWVSPRRELRPLRDAGLQLLSQSTAGRHNVAVHWGMIMAAYPFWSSVASETGRLLRLQGTVTAQQIRRRLVERYGDRELIGRATRNVVRSFVDWQVLAQSGKNGVYVQNAPAALTQTELIAWLIEALLHSHPSHSMPLKAAFQSTSFFPFRLDWIPAGRLLAASGRLEVLLYGLDQEVIRLRDEHASSPQPGRKAAS